MGKRQALKRPPGGAAKAAKASAPAEATGAAKTKPPGEAADAEKTNAPTGPPAEAAGAESAFPGFGAFSFTSKKEPVEITSEKLDFDYKARRVVFHGNVEVVQGQIHLRSDVLTVDYLQAGDGQQLKEVTADGHVAITQGPKKATGKRAVFDQSNRTLVLSGDAVLEEGANQVNGDQIVVHPDDSRMEVLGQNRRVKVILFPGQGPLAQDGSGRTPATAGPVAAPTPAATPETQTNGPGNNS
ncbi:MAG: lipopolysaccharide transport periplasmic protein LptA [Deltaproteobacteria bacterium]|nr:lipopolysaccharide transport periplasmic protein LptA [Deltaproteobacteria bacterium]